jgi:formiminotetrahydrofolate cyclodeaminase
VRKEDIAVRDQNVLADVAAAAIAARAALEVALINVEANLAAIRASSRGRELSERLAEVSGLAVEAERTVRGIRRRQTSEVHRGAGVTD